MTSPRCRFFGGARRAGLSSALEHLSISRAFEQLDDLFPGLRLNVNVSPEALALLDVQALRSRTRTATSASR